MKYVVQGAVTPLTTSVTPPAQDLVDKWGPTEGRCPAIFPRPRPFFSLARTITFTEMQPRDWQNDPFFQVPRRDPRYPWARGSAELARTVFDETITPDKWTPEGRIVNPTRPVRFNISAQAPHVQAAPEAITSDKWTPSEGMVVRPVPCPIRETVLLYAPPAAPEGPVTLDKWNPPYAEVRRVRPRPFFANARTVTFTEMFPLDWNVTPDAHIVARRPNPRDFYAPSNYPVAAGPAETITLDKWFTRPIRTSARQPFISRYRSVQYAVEIAEDITLDKWIGSLGQAGRALKRSASRELVSSSRPTSFLETITLDKWLGSGKLMRPARYPLFDRNILIPFFGPGAAETLTLDKWFGSQGRVILPKRRSISKELNDYPRLVTFGEVVTLDKWLGSSGRVVIPAKRSSSRELASYGVPASFIELVTMDKWVGSQGKIVRPSWRSLSKELNEYPRLTTFGEVIRLDKWEGSQGRMIDTRRVVRRDAVNQSLITFEPITLDKWVGSLGQVIRALRRSSSRELVSTSRPAQFNEIITMDKWESVWNHLVIRGPRQPLIVDLKGHVLIPMADAATGRLYIYHIAADNRVYRIPPEMEPIDIIDGLDRIYRVAPPEQ